MKKFWEKVKALGVKIWQLFVAWFKSTALPWLKMKWMRIVDLILFFIVYGVVGSAGLVWLEAIIGLWIFVLLGYYIFWQFLGFGKVVKSLKKKK